MKYYYLFKDPNQGYYNTYTPFTCTKELTQEIADKLMRNHGPSVDRAGCSLNMLIDVAGENGYEITPYYTTYKKKINYNEFNAILTPEQIDDYQITLDNIKLDWLPNDFIDWPIIRGKAGIFVNLR